MATILYVCMYVYWCMYVCMYLFIYSPAWNQHTHIKPEGQQGPEALTAARNKNVSIQY